MKKLIVIIAAIFFIGCSQESPAAPALPKTRICVTAPTVNVDNSPIDGDFAGYVFYAGTVTGVYPIEIDNPDPTLICVTYLTLGLGDGTWFVAATAYDNLHQESPYSNELNFTILNGVSRVITTAAPGLSLQ